MANRTLPLGLSKVPVQSEVTGPRKATAPAAAAVGMAAVRGWIPGVKAAFSSPAIGNHAAYALQIAELGGKVPPALMNKLTTSEKTMIREAFDRANLEQMKSAYATTLATLKTIR